MDVLFKNIPGFLIFWILPVLAALFIYAGRKRVSALRILSGLSTVKNRNIKSIALLIAFSCIVIAVTRPVWNKTTIAVQNKGRDVVFLVDVSKSMLADDLQPTRLEHAKLAVKDSLTVMNGDRVALVAFAGNSVIKCPLTMDYSFFSFAVDSLSTDSVSRGGTLIGDALRKIRNEVFDNQEKGYKDIILITDGEDHESFPVEAAGVLGEAGIRLLAIGLGDEFNGKRIPVTDGDGSTSFLTYDGQEVWSRLDAASLREMADVTPGGRYLNVSTGTFDLGSIYKTLVAEEAQKNLSSQEFVQFEEKFQIFLFAALVFLFIEAGYYPRRKK